MPDPKKPDTSPASDVRSDKVEPAPEDYSHRNSGRRASGHGGGDMDAPEEFPEAHHEAGYDFSGGGRGHEANRSLAHETDEDLESRSGPYTRAGKPGKPPSEPGHKKK